MRKETGQGHETMLGAHGKASRRPLGMRPRHVAHCSDKVVLRRRRRRNKNKLKKKKKKKNRQRKVRISSRDDTRIIKVLALAFPRILWLKARAHQTIVVLGSSATIPSDSGPFPSAAIGRSHSPATSSMRDSLQVRALGTCGEFLQKSRSEQSVKRVL